MISLAQPEKSPHAHLDLEPPRRTRPGKTGRWPVRPGEELR